MDEENRGDSLQSPRKDQIITTYIIIKFYMLSIPVFILCISPDSSNNKGPEKNLENYDRNNAYALGVYFLYWSDQRELALSKIRN